MKKTVLWVISLHFFALLLMGVFSSPQKPKKVALKVHSMSARPPPVAVVAAPKSEKKSVAKATPPAPVPVKQQESKPAPPPVKKVEKKKGVVTAATPAPTKKAAPAPAPKKASSPPAPKQNAEVQKLLSSLEESLTRIESKSAPTKKTTAAPAASFDVPKWSGKLMMESEGDDISDPGYENHLIGYLRSILNLPEVGEVKIRLTLQNNGAFVKLQVLRAQSAKNRSYLEVELPHLHFPRLTGALSHEKQHIFVITFCNEL